MYALVDFCMFKYEVVVEHTSRCPFSIWHRLIENKVYERKGLANQKVLKVYFT